MHNLWNKFLLLIVFSVVITTLHGNSLSKGTLDTSYVWVQSGKHRLYTQIIKPNNINGKLPAFLFLVGSGESSSMKRYEDFTDFFLTSQMDRRSFIFVTFDKKGIGNSSGEWYKDDFKARAKDAYEVGKMVQVLTEVNTDSIFIIGHSQGGWIVQEVLATYPSIFAGGVSMAGPVSTVKEQIINDYTSQYICSGFSKEKAEINARKKVNKILLVAHLFPYNNRLKQLKRIKKYDPRSSILFIKKPILYLWASNDALVDPLMNRERLLALFPEGNPSHVSIDIISDVDHSFKVVMPCYTGPRKNLKFSEVTRDALWKWVGK